MVKRLFIFWIEFSLYFLQALFCPFLRLILPLISKRAKERLDFELLNTTDPASRPFSLDKLKADACFEFSSEGELEQLFPLIDDFLKREKKVELVYFSESVEKKVKTLYEKYPSQIRSLRFPLISYSFHSLLRGQSLTSFVTAKKLILCRYDFFPELFVLGSREDFSFFLINASLKSRAIILESGGIISKILKFYWFCLYDLFDFIIASSLSDKKRFEKLSVSSEKLEFFDFRIVQILKRTLNAKEVLLKAQNLADFELFLESFPKEKRLILGSAYPFEMGLFENSEFLAKILSGEFFVSIAPHKLKEADLSLLREAFEKSTKISATPIALYEIHKEMKQEEVKELFSKMKRSPGVLLITVPGVLCELYTLFGQSFVGGGHLRSIHSVLEPYVAGARIYVGPKVFRSTEFDIVSSFSPKYIHRLENLKEFYPLFLRNSLSGIGEESVKRKELLFHEESRFQGILDHVR